MYKDWKDFAIKNKLVIDCGVDIPIPFIVHSLTASTGDISFLHFNNKKILKALELVCNEYKLKVMPGITEAWIRTTLDSSRFLFLYKDFVDQYTSDK